MVPALSGFSSAAPLAQAFSLMNIKVFTVTHSNEMEENVNRWLGDNTSAEIHHVHQSESMNADSWSMTLTVFYSTNGDSRIGFETPASRWSGNVSSP
jgi:hypothetical protein